MSSTSKRPTAVEEVMHSVISRIRSGELLPGDQLPNEQQIALENGVGRGSVREAMRILRSLGVVSVRHGDGTFVSPPGELPYFEPLLVRLLLDGPTMDQLRELRLVVEWGMLPLILSNRTTEDLEALAKAVTTLRDEASLADTSASRLVELDLAFHRALADATHNPAVARLYRTIMELYTPAIAGAYESHEPASAGAQLHESLLTAIGSRDRSAAEESLRDAAGAWGAWKERSDPNSSM